MKKVLFLSLCLLGFFGTQRAQAQIDVTVNPLGLLFSDLTVGGDYVFRPDMSVELAVGFGTGSVGDTDFSNIGGNLVGKYYFNPSRGGDKFYADVFLKFINRKWDYDNTSGIKDYNSTRFGLGIGIGYKWVTARGIVFELGAGVGRALVDKNSIDDNVIEWTKVMTQGKLGIGYRFGAKEID